MKKVSLLITCIGISLSLFAQEKVAEFEHSVPLEKNEYFSYSNLEYKPSENELILYGLNVKPAMVYIKKEGKNTGFGSGVDYIPFVYKAILNPDKPNEDFEEAINLKTLESFNLDGKVYKAVNPSNQQEISNSETAIPLDVLEAKYPKVFPPAPKEISLHQLKVEAGWKEFYISEFTQPYKYHEMDKKLVKQEPSYDKHKIELGDDYRIILEKGIVDNERRLAIAATMRGEKKDKLAGYKNKRIYITKGEEILHQFDLEFGHVKSLIFAQGLGRSAQDTIQSFEEGAILIYGRPFGIGKKKNDPDLTRYYVAMLDNNGKLLSKSEFHFGDDKYSLEPYYAFKKGEKTFVFGKTVSKDNPGYAVLTFDKTGLVDSKNYSTNEIKGIVNGPYDEGITTKYGRGFRPLDHFVLANGETLVYGEAYDKSQEYEEQKMANGETRSVPKTVYTYKSQVFLRFDPDGEIKGLNVIPKMEGTQNEVNFLEKVTEVNSKVYLLGEEKPNDKKYSSIIKLDYAANEAAKTKLSDYEVYDLRGKLVHEFYNDNNTMVFLGKSDDPEFYTLKSVVLKLD